MTLTTTTSRVSYPGAGSTGPFAIPFRFFSFADLEVIRTNVAGVDSVITNGGGYTGTGQLNATGALTLSTVLAIGELLTIRRAPALTQTTSIRNQGTYFPATIEDQFDRMVMQMQALQDQIDTGLEVSTLVPDQGAVIGWNDGALSNLRLDSSAVALPGNGRTTTTLSQYLANNAVINVKDYGAIADWNGTDGTDNWAAFTLAMASFPHDSGVNRASRGGKLISYGRYKIGNTLVIEKQITWEGGGLGFWEYAAGTELAYTGNKTGVRIYSMTESPSGTSGAGTKISGVFFYCTNRLATGHGIHASAQFEIDHFAIANFAEHNMYVVADASIGQGQASKSIFRNGQIDDAGKHNFYLSGDDVNVCLVDTVQCSNAGVGFWNFYDDSGIGNTYINTLTQGTGGSYKTTRVTASHLFLGCYTEGGLAEIIRPSIIIGGTLANTNRLSPTSTCLVINGDGLIRRAMNFIGSATRTVAGDTPTSAVFGDDTAPPGQSGTVFAFGADEESGPAHRLKYNATSKWWMFEYANSSSARSIQIPGGLATKPFYGPLFENGFYQGATNNLVSRTLDTAAPTTGAWVRGSIVYNSAPSAGGFIGWVCTVAGTPGTWRTFGVIS